MWAIAKLYYKLNLYILGQYLPTWSCLFNLCSLHALDFNNNVCDKQKDEWEFISKRVRSCLYAHAWGCDKRLIARTFIAQDLLPTIVTNGEPYDTRLCKPLVINYLSYIHWSTHDDGSVNHGQWCILNMCEFLLCIRVSNWSSCAVPLEIFG